MPVAPLCRLEQFPQAISAEGAVGRDSGAAGLAALGLANEEFPVALQRQAAVDDRVDAGQGRQFGPQAIEEFAGAASSGDDLSMMVVEYVGRQYAVGPNI